MKNEEKRDKNIDSELWIRYKIRKKMQKCGTIYNKREQYYVNNKV